MIFSQNILMIGSSERNLGKTEFICRLIAKQSVISDIVGLKITVIEDVDGVVLKPSSQHCDSFFQLDGDFTIFHETDKAGRKDTHRMLRAGAKEVFWVVALRSKLPEAMVALEQTFIDYKIRKTTPVVLEGNSVRHLIEPGLFLIIKGQGRDIVKESCLQVLPLADKLVDSYGEGWSIDINQIDFNNGAWVLKEDAAAVILAGGQSRRMGQDKASLTVGNGTMLQHIHGQLEEIFPQVLVSMNTELPYQLLGSTIVNDIAEGNGPLMGILSCLEQSDHEANFICACDCPNIDVRFVRHMISVLQGYDVVVPMCNGRPEPLFAVYSRNTIPKIKEQLARGVNKVQDLFAELKVNYQTLEGSWYTNLNTPEQFKQFSSKV